MWLGTIAEKTQGMNNCTFKIVRIALRIILHNNNKGLFNRSTSSSITFLTASNYTHTEGLTKLEGVWQYQVGGKFVQEMGGKWEVSPKNHGSWPCKQTGGMVVSQLEHWSVNWEDQGTSAVSKHGLFFSPHITCDFWKKQ